MKEQLIHILFVAASIALAACSGQTNDKPGKTEMVENSSLGTSNNTKISAADSIKASKDELAKIYSKAIADYIEAIHKKDKMAFDTLFIAKRENGQPDDFPDIELPENIGGVKILLLPADKTKDHRQSYRKSSPFINLVGWVNEHDAEFIFVAFYPDTQHKHDCYITYQYNSSKNEFELERLRIEILVPGKDGKADYYAIYEHGKYIGDKPITK